MANEDLERGGTKARGNSNPTGYYANQYSIDSSERLTTSWLVPSIVVANVAAFIVLMYVNNCPKNNKGLYGDCVAKFLGRLSFQPLKENPLFGPSSSK